MSEYAKMYRAVENGIRAIGRNIRENGSRDGRVIDFDLEGEDGRKWRLWTDKATIKNIRTGYATSSVAEIARELFSMDFAGFMFRYDDGAHLNRAPPPPADHGKEIQELREWEAKSTGIWDEAVGRQKVAGCIWTTTLDAWLTKKGILPDDADDLPFLRLDAELATAVVDENHVAAITRQLEGEKPPVVSIPLFTTEGMVRALQHRATEGAWRFTAGRIADRFGMPAAYGQPQAARRAKRVVLTEGAADTLVAMSLLRDDADTVVVGAYNAADLPKWGKFFAAGSTEVVVCPHIGDSSGVGLTKGAEAIVESQGRARFISYDRLLGDLALDAFDLADAVAEVRKTTAPADTRRLFLEALGGK